jgi:predicted DNA-binding protein (MmcQ/YjbR family)
MTRDEMITVCAAFPAATHVVQWGNADVYKVGGKVFAILGMGDSGTTVTFKATEMALKSCPTAPARAPPPIWHRAA